MIETFQSTNLLEHLMLLLNDQIQCNEIFHCLHPSWCLSLIANIVHLAEICAETEQFEKDSSTVFIVSFILLFLFVNKVNVFNQFKKKIFFLMISFINNKMYSFFI